MKQRFFRVFFSFGSLFHVNKQHSIVDIPGYMMALCKQLRSEPRRSLRIESGNACPPVGMTYARNAL